MRKRRDSRELVIVSVSPSMAEWAASLSRQEDIDLQKVDRLSRCMLSAKWNPERHRDRPVCLHTNRITNGNHRMLAIVAAGIDVDCYVFATPSVIESWKER